MEKNKKRVFTGTVAMLVILFGLLRIAIFTGYHMVTPFLPEIARNLDTTIVVIGLAISIRSAMGFLGPVWGGIIDLFGKKNSLLIALLTFAASYAAIYFFLALLSRYPFPMPRHSLLTRQCTLTSAK